MAAETIGKAVSAARVVALETWSCYFSPRPRRRASEFV